MGSVIRPVFTNGERLTAQRLNEIVEYLRTSLRRTLLAPLSPGVAAGLELQATPALNLPGPMQLATVSPLLAAPTVPSVATVMVSPGVAIDGVARILVSTQGLSFTSQDIAAQISDLAVGDQVLVSLGADSGAASSVPAVCAPTTGTSVSEGVKLFFSRLPVTNTQAFGLASAFESTPSPSVNPWADPIDQGGSAASYAVPLGSVIYQQDTTLIPSAAQRTGVTLTVGALHNSFGDVSLLLDRINGIPALGVAVPTVFQPTAPAFFETFAGGALVQAAVLATDLGMPPAGRPNASAPNVFEAAGGNSGLPAGGAPGAAGSSGVVAISMQYDPSVGAQVWSLFGGFPTVPHSGFPLVLSTNATGGQPLVSAPNPDSMGNVAYIGLSAAASQPASTASGVQLVPVATSGIVLAYVSVPPATQLVVGTPLTPAATPISPPTSSPPQWGLLGANAGNVVVAQLAIQINNSSTTTAIWVPAWVWVVAPYPQLGSTTPTPTPGAFLAAARARAIR